MGKHSTRLPAVSIPLAPSNSGHLTVQKVSSITHFTDHHRLQLGIGPEENVIPVVVEWERGEEVSVIRWRDGGRRGDWGLAGFLCC